jgi:hypothetical protein
VVQKPSLKGMPTKSRVWLEAECLRLARRTIGEIQSVTIRRLRKGTRPNWKVADIIPQPYMLLKTTVSAPRSRGACYHRRWLDPSALSPP